MGKTMNKIITYAAMLIVGILIGSLAFYTWTQITSPEAPLNTAYTQYGQSDEMGYFAWLKVTGINGTSSEERHSDMIEILEYTWGETIDAFAVFNAMGAVSPDYSDFTFVFWWDEIASAKLLRACTRGEIIEEAVLYVHSRYPTTIYDFIRIRLRNVIVSSFQTYGNVFEGEHPLVEISLAFRRIDIMAYRILDTGAVRETYSFSWDYVTNSEP
jgi:type VI secretion system secreted protein Hcp